MKPISQVAKERVVNLLTVTRIAKEEGITSVVKLTDIQVDHVHQVLHKKGYFQFLTLESKMNTL